MAIGVGVALSLCDWMMSPNEGAEGDRKSGESQPVAVREMSDQPRRL